MKEIYLVEIVPRGLFRLIIHSDFLSGVLFFFNAGAI